MTETPSRARSLHEIRMSTLSVLADVIGTGREVALLQAPNQRNVGDTLIWLGERQYLEALGLRLRYVSDLWSYDPAVLRSRLPEGGTILLHGGGNFGDLWYSHQLHRERVARDLPDYPVVQLPQSIYFGDAERAAQADGTLGSHPDFTVLVRDSISRARAAEQLPHVKTVYCWDMALGWAPPTSAYSAPDPGRARRPLVLARSDVEAASGLADAFTSRHRAPFEVDLADWRVRGLDAAAWRALRLLPLASHRVRPLRGTALQPLQRQAVTAINAINVRGGIRLFAGRPLLVVDRLHAHVLAALLGIPHVVLDNSYRKISAVFDEYTHCLPGAHYAADVDEAVTIARGLLSAPAASGQGPAR